jgi:hypothetical protein
LEPLTLRDNPIPELLVVVRLGSVTLKDDALHKSVDESHDRWGIWGFSVLEVPGGDYQLLARLRPLVATRRLLFVANGPDLVAAGFPLLPTLDHPHWTVVLSARRSSSSRAYGRPFTALFPIRPGQVGAEP